MICSRFSVTPTLVCSVCCLSVLLPLVVTAAPKKLVIEDLDGALRALRSKRLNDVSCSLVWLGEHPDQRAVDGILGLLRNRPMWLRKQAARTLGRIGDKRAVEPLCLLLEELLEFTQRQARWTPNREDAPYAMAAAIEALGFIGDCRAVGTLCKVLRADHEALLAVKALGMIGDPQALETLYACAPYGLSEGYPEYQEAIRKIGDNRPAAEILEDCVSHKSCCTWIAQSALEKKEPADIAAAIHASKALLYNPYTWGECQDSLVQAHGKALSAPLIELLAVEVDGCRLAFAAGILGRIGDDTAVRPLLAVLDAHTVPAIYYRELCWFKKHPEMDRVLRTCLHIPEVAIQYAPTLISEGEQSSVSLLVGTLAKTGSVYLCELLLNSDEPTLVRTAEEWMVQHNYRATTEYGHAPVHWGGK